MIGFKKIILLFVGLYCTSFPAFAERVELKTGEIYDGNIIDRKDSYITLRTGGAPIYLPLDQIKQISVDSVQSESVANKNSEPDASVINSLVPSQPLLESASQESSKSSESSVEPAAHFDAESKLIDGKDGIFYYERAKANFASKEYKQSMLDLYYSYVLGVEDTEGLKQKLQDVAHQLAKTNETNRDDSQLIETPNDRSMKSIPFGTMPAGWIVFLVIAAVVLGLLQFVGKKEAKTQPSPFLTEGPESVTLKEPKPFVRAGPNKRVCAYLIDVFISMLLMLPASFVLGMDYHWIINSLYFLFKDSVNARSIGKRVVGIQIVNELGDPASSNQTIIRNLAWVVPSVISLLHPIVLIGGVLITIVEYLSMVRDLNGQRIIGDKMALTRVHDLKPQRSDMMFLWWSFLVVVISIIIYMGSSVVFARS